MKSMGKFIGLWLLVVQLLLPLAVYAGPREDFEEARNWYIFTVACRAAYSDHIGILAREALKDQGWEIVPYVQRGQKVDARFLLIKNNSPEVKRPEYILAVTGTENVKDVLTDLRYDKVYFAGTTWEEFALNAEKKGIPNDQPKVHRGFHQYVQTALSTPDPKEPAKRLVDRLVKEQEEKLYIVGHSLGGAVATLSGARLLSMGVAPDKLEVITFGAPAVGNAAFRHQFEGKLPLTRVVTHGDPVASLLRDWVGSYEQFGREIKWEGSDTVRQYSHDIVLYMDVAIKNYYDKRGIAVQAGEWQLSHTKETESGKGQVYVAPIKNSLSQELQSEFSYMKEALWDEYRDDFPGYKLADGVPQERRALLEKAAQTGCEWLVIPEIESYKMKDERNVFYITLRQTVYQVATGSIVQVAEFGSNTRQLTPLEALIRDALSMNGQNNYWWEMGKN